MTKATRKDKTTAESDDPDQVRPVRSPKAARWTLLVLTVISLALLVLIEQPFAAALFIGAVMAGALSPWDESLAAGVLGRRQNAARPSPTTSRRLVELPHPCISGVVDTA